MFRVLLILAVTLSASLAGAVATEHGSMTEHKHHAAESIDVEAPMCCESGTERAHTCFTMPVMLEGTGAYGDALPPSGGAFELDRRILTGVLLSGPLDPPRTV